MMFAPEGYVGFGQMVEFLSDWAHSTYLAYVVEEDGRDPTKVFAEVGDAHRMLLTYRTHRLKKDTPEHTHSKDDVHWQRHIETRREDSFFVGIIYQCLLSKTLMKLETLLASPDGRIMEPDDYMFVHMDRLDWIYPSWPLRQSPELAGIIDYFDQGIFHESDLSERYCFLDNALGTIRLKNNSISGFKRSSHFGDDAVSGRYVETQVEPFVAWSVVWNGANLPDDFPQFFENIGLLEERWNVPNALNSSETDDNRPTGKKRGAKPTGAKQEFFRLYPDGKPDDLSADAIAAELTESGFPISGRQVQNYAKEIKGK